MRIIWFDGSEMTCNEIVFAGDGSLMVDGYRHIDISEIERIETI